MYTRKLIDFFFPEKQITHPLPSPGPAPKAEFDWPPSAEDLAAFSVIPLHGDDGSEIAPVSDVA
jgi:hypothetical protein